LQGVLGTFDSLNPFIVKGLPPQGIRAPLVSGANVITGYVVESLMARGYDEPFTSYGLVARAVEDRRRAQLRDLFARSGARFFRRPAGDARGHSLLLAALARQRPAQPPLLLFQGRQAETVGEHAVRLRSCRRRRPRAAADPRLMPVLAPARVNADTFDGQNLVFPLRSAAGPTWSARLTRAGA